MTDNDPAVEAATDALVERLTRTGDNLPLAGILPTARILVAAARPIIEAEMRERIAADIDAADAPGRPTDWSLDEGLTIASRIARGEQ